MAVRSKNRTVPQVLAFAVLALILVTVASLLHGEEVLMVAVPRNQAHTVDAGAIPESASIEWTIEEPAGKSFLPSADLRKIVFFTENHPRIIVVREIIDWEARKKTKIKTVIVPGGVDPVPPPGPDPKPPEPAPKPTGFALEVYNEAIKVKRPADCLKLADNFENVGAMIAAGGITDLVTASNELRRLNDELNLHESWRPFGVWLGSKMDANAQSMPDLMKIIAQTVAGLRSAGGVQ